MTPLWKRQLRRPAWKRALQPVLVSDFDPLAPIHIAANRIRQRQDRALASAQTLLDRLERRQ